MSEETTTRAMVPAQAMPKDARTALRRGDLDGLVAALVGDPDKLTVHARSAVERMGRTLIAYRRRDIAELGDHEAYVVHDEHGSLRQVVKPVLLSMDEGTLYQIPSWQKDEQTGRWGNVVKDPHRAHVSAQGYHRINQVAGCTILQPPTVVVDGETRTNPYIQRSESDDGRVGDVLRIVIAYVVVGPSPMTASPVVVNYTLDYDPSKDLQNMLAGVAKKEAAQCFLIGEEDFREWRSEMPPQERFRWRWQPVHRGVGLAHNLRADKVREAYSKYIEIVQNALKKAQTVARRNAMKAHPALAFQTVVLDEKGRARIPVVGWAGSRASLRQYSELMERVARGQDVDAELRDLAETYDPERDVTGDAETDVIDHDDVMRRNELVERYTLGLGLLSPSQADAFPDPGALSDEELEGHIRRINALVDAGGAA